MTSITSVANCIENHYQSQCVSGRFVWFLFENNNHYQYFYLKKRYNSKKKERDKVENPAEAGFEKNKASLEFKGCTQLNTATFLGVAVAVVITAIN